MFKIPLFSRNAIQIEEGVSCSEGFHLAANDSNSDLAQYSGAFQAGPCRHIDDDEPGWYHFIDAGRRRIIRIRTEKSTSAFLAKIGSNPWCLSVWNDPEHETVLMRSEGQSIDDVKFPGLKLTPAKKIKGMKDGYSNAALAKDSVKLMYFGGEDVRSHVFIPVFEKVSSSCAVFSSKVYVFQNLICFRRMVPLLSPVHQKTQNIFRHRCCTVRSRGATGSIARQVRPAAAIALTQSPDHFLLK
jgi:hypothetical protein